MTHFSIAHPTSLSAFLNRIQRKPNKSLSQNFLIDQNIIHKIIDSSDLTSNDIVLEIGPGAGALTEAILNKGSSVIAIEKDSVLAKELQNRFSNENFSLIISDFLDVNLSTILPQNQKVKVISSLPYQLTTPIIYKLLLSHKNFSSMTLIMQKEVVERILAKPQTKSYSLLSIYSHFFAKPDYLFDINSSCFFPKPSVTSSTLRLTVKESHLEDELQFIELVRKGFNQRRKMLSSSLPFSSEVIQKKLNDLNLNPQSRPEDLALEDWMRFFLSLKEI